MQDSLLKLSAHAFVFSGLFLGFFGCVTNIYQQPPEVKDMVSSTNSAALPIERT